MYYLVFLIGLMFSLITFKNNSKDYRILYFVLFFMISLLAFLRYGVGPDYFSYRMLFNALNPSLIKEFNSLNTDQEVGFRLMGSIIKAVGVPYYGYIIILASINLLFVHLLIKEYSKNKILSLFIYFTFFYFVYTFSALRQGLTLTIGVYFALRCFDKSKHGQLIILITILSLFHKSVFIILPIYLISLFSISKRQYIILFSTALLFNLIPKSIFIDLIRYVPILNRVMFYLGSEIDLITFFNFPSIIRMVLFTFALYYYNSLKNENEKSNFIVKFYLNSLIIYFFFKFSELTAARISIYGKYLEVLLLPNILYLYKDKIEKYTFATLIILLCTFYFNKELNNMFNSSLIVPYSSKYVEYTHLFNFNRYQFNHFFYDK